MQKFIALALCLVFMLKLAPLAVNLQRNGSKLISDSIDNQNLRLSKVEAEELFTDLWKDEFTGYDIVGLIEYYEDSTMKILINGREATKNEVNLEKNYRLEIEKNKIEIKEWRD